MAGSVAQMLMKSLAPATKVVGYASQIGPIEISPEERTQVLKKNIDEFQARLHPFGQ